MKDDKEFWNCKFSDYNEYLTCTDGYISEYICNHKNNTTKRCVVYSDVDNKCPFKD